MFYDIFTSLCEENNVTPTQVRQDLGISQSTMASWKSRNLTPNATTLVQLAEYFHTTPAYLVGNKYAKEPLKIDFSLPDYPVRIPTKKDLDSLSPTERNYYNLRLLADVAPDALQRQLIENYRKLNKLGQVEAVRRLKELALLSEYTQPDPNNSLRKNRTD